MNILKVTEVADYLRISKYQVYRLIKEGKLKAINIANGSIRPHFRIKKEDLDAGRSNDHWDAGNFCNRKAHRGFRHKQEREPARSGIKRW